MTREQIDTTAQQFSDSLERAGVSLVEFAARADRQLLKVDPLEDEAATRSEKARAPIMQGRQRQVPLEPPLEQGGEICAGRRLRSQQLAKQTALLDRASLELWGTDSTLAEALDDRGCRGHDTARQRPATLADGVTTDSSSVAAAQLDELVQSVEAIPSDLAHAGGPVCACRQASNSSAAPGEVRI